MSNSSRIEKATRQHVGAVLTSEQIHELVKLSNPEWKGGVYPSDAAYKRDADGKLVPRGKTAYGDGVLEYLGENSFKVLADKDIVRRPGKAPKKAAAPAPTPTVTVTPTPTPAVAEKKKGKKAVKSASRIPVAPKQKANLAKAVQ